MSLCANLTPSIIGTTTCFFFHTTPVAIQYTSGHPLTLVQQPQWLRCFSSSLSSSSARVEVREECSIVWHPDIRFEKMCEREDDEGEEDKDEDEEDKDEEDDEVEVEFEKGEEKKNIIHHHISSPIPTTFRPLARLVMKKSLREWKEKRKDSKSSNTIEKKIQQLQQKIAKENVKEFIQKQRDFRASDDGQEALSFCRKLGATGNALVGCMQDMRLSGNKTIARKAVRVTEKAALMDKKNTVKAVITTRSSQSSQSTKTTRMKKTTKTTNSKPRMCTASGDPHFTNFNGEYFHLQEPAIFTFARSKDGQFEVQVRQDGATRVGETSYVRAVKIRYGEKTYTSNFVADGWIVRQDGTTLSVTAPANYEGEMEGVCGEDQAVKGAHNFKLPDGSLADVDYGKQGWEMGGYGGPSSKLSKWHLAWRPSVEKCLFSVDECKQNLMGLYVPPKVVKVVKVVKTRKTLRRRG